MQQRRGHEIACCVVLGIALSLISTACANDEQSPRGSAGRMPEQTLSVPSECVPSAARKWGKGPLVEVRGRASAGQVWALVHSGLPVRSGQALKIVWSVSGSGGFSVFALDSDGMKVDPQETEAHIGGTWRRPGRDWGTVFILPHGGCWLFRISHGETTGEIALRAV